MARDKTPYHHFSTLLHQKEGVSFHCVLRSAQSHGYVSFFLCGGRLLGPSLVDVVERNSPPTADPHPARTFLQRSSLSSFYLLERVFGAMSYAGRTPAPRPPDRGSFPLDHDGECASSMREYLDCMKRARNNNSLCREQSKRYLECRMDR